MTKFPRLLKRFKPQFLPTALLATSVCMTSILACKKNSLSSTDNFVKDENGNLKALIFSFSQDEAKVGMYRLCKRPNGEKFKGYEKCLQIVKEFENKNSPVFEENSPSAPPSSTEISASADPASGQSPADNASNNDSAAGGNVQTAEPSQPFEPFSQSGSAQSNTLNLNDPEGTGNQGSPQLVVDKKDVKKVENPLFTGDHKAPRCWYRYNIEKNFPDLFSTSGRVNTFKASQLLTTYSISSETILQAMQSDTSLKKLKLEKMYDLEDLVAENYNKNIDALTTMPLWVPLNTAIATKLGAFEPDMVSKALKKGSQSTMAAMNALSDSMLNVAMKNRPNPMKIPKRVIVQTSQRIAKAGNWAYRTCFKGNFVVSGMCIAAVSLGMSKATEVAVNAWSQGTLTIPTIDEMTPEDLATATNMFASAKTNISIPSEDFEKLAYIPPREGASTSGGWFGIGRQPLRDIGIIPRLGDKVRNGFLCPNERIAAEIAQFPPLTDTQYAEIAAEFDKRISGQGAGAP